MSQPSIPVAPVARPRFAWWVISSLVVGAIMAFPCGFGAGWVMKGANGANKSADAPKSKSGIGNAAPAFLALSDAEKARWKRMQLKYRDEAKDEPSRHYQCLVYSLKAKSWASASVAVEMLDRTEKPIFEMSLPRYRDARFGTTYLREEDSAARERAITLAAMPDVCCVAIVDLFSGETPSVLEWVHDRGRGGAQTSANLPFPELSDSFKEFIRHLQTVAE